MIARRRAGRREGQAIIEFAAIFIVLFLFITGLMVIGQILRGYLIITNASREGARYAAAGETNEEAERAARSRALGLEQDHVRVEIDPANDQDRVPGGPIQVTVFYDVPLWVPIYNMFLPNPFPLKSITTMTYEVNPGEGYIPPGDGGGGDDGGGGGGDDGGGGCDDDDDGGHGDDGGGVCDDDDDGGSGDDGGGSEDDDDDDGGHGKGKGHGR